MNPTINITAEWEHLDNGTDEERACFAALGIQCNGRWLTEGGDPFVNRIRTEPLLSAYHFAEWLAWNWWRLRWEPRSKVENWSLSHRLSTIGHGYVWPNITVFSDGERTALIANPTPDQDASAFRYISDYAGIVPSRIFESAVDQFVNQVLSQLKAEGVTGTNLNRIWADLTDERQNPDLARRRKLEALLGRDPDEGDTRILESLIGDVAPLGERAVEELAADQAAGGMFLSAEDLGQIAEKSGFPSSPQNVVRLHSGGRLPPQRDVPPWRLAAEAAHALRNQENFGEEPISDGKLAALVGTDARVLENGSGKQSISFALDKTTTQGRIVLRSRWPAGRRFELARLLADKVVGSEYGKLHAATRAYTYRQQMQRSFAAEFLSPFDAVEHMLEGDYSSEAQQDVAEHFHVSPLTIRTLLVNHHRLERDELLEESGVAA